MMIHYCILLSTNQDIVNIHQLPIRQYWNNQRKMNLYLLDHILYPVDAKNADLYYDDNDPSKSAYGQTIASKPGDRKR